MNPRKLAGRIEAVYARLPRMTCRGLCQDCCGPIAMSDAEWRRIERERGALPVFDSLDLTCPLLDAGSGRCTMYALRPLVCRIWGMTLRLRCPHGCQPERWLTDAEVWRLLRDLDAITGRQHRWLMPEGWDEFMAQRPPARTLIEAMDREMLPTKGEPR